jgi:hypothetical protein
LGGGDNSYKGRLSATGKIFLKLLGYLKGIIGVIEHYSLQVKKAVRVYVNKFKGKAVSFFPSYSGTILINFTGILIAFM